MKYFINKYMYILKVQNINMKQPWWGYKIALKPVEKLGEVIKLVTIYVNMLFFHELFIFPLSQGKYSQKNKLL